MRHWAVLLSIRGAAVYVRLLFMARVKPIPSIFPTHCSHYNDVIMSMIASQITSLTFVYSTVYSGADQRKHQGSASLAFVWGIHRSPVNSPHKWPVTRKMFPFDDVIMQREAGKWCLRRHGWQLQTVFATPSASNTVTFSVILYSDVLQSQYNWKWILWWFVPRCAHKCLNQCWWYLN